MTTKERISKENVLTHTRNFLEHQGYEILEDLGCDGILNLVCKDEGAIVLVSIRLVEASKDCSGGFGESLPYPREEIERATFELMTKRDVIPANHVIRYDEVAIKAITKNQVYIRHHINAQRYGQN